MVTPTRTIRIPDEIWHAAVAKAAREGTSLSDLVREFLTAYLAE